MHTHQTAAIQRLRNYRIRPTPFWLALAAVGVICVRWPQAALLLASLTAVVLLRLLLPKIDFDAQCDDPLPPDRYP